MYAVSERVAFSNPSNKPDLIILLGFPGGPEVKASACNAGDLDSIPGLGRSPGERNGESHGRRSLVGYGVHRVAKSRTRLSHFTSHKLLYVKFGTNFKIQLEQTDYPRNKNKKPKKWIFMSVSKLMPVQLRKKIVNWNEMFATHITTNR